jgi:hypothetical protein
MRLGGAFPFGQAAVPVALPAGGVFYVPAGNYFVSPGGQTVMQYFDPVLLSWRNVDNPQGGMHTVISCDGYNYRLINMSGVVNAAVITNAGSGAVNGIGQAATGVAVSFGAAPANGQAAAAYAVVGGALSGIVITNGGSGFVVAPIIVIDAPPPGGVQATATCTISGGVINAVTLVNPGAGYTAVPNVYVIPQYSTYVGIGVPVNPAGPPSIVPPGILNFQQPPFFPGINWTQVQQSPSGAVLTAGALTGSGTVTAIVMTAYGAGYTGTTIPTITITGAGAAAATAIPSFCFISATNAGGAGYTVGAPFITSLTPTGATPVLFNNNNAFGPRAARGRLTATSGNTSVVEDPGFGLQGVVNVGVLEFGNAALPTIGVFTAVVGGITDTSVLQPALMD